MSSSETWPGRWKFSEAMKRRHTDQRHSRPRVSTAVASVLDESHSTLFGRSYDLSNPSSRQQAIDWLTGLIIEVEERL